jgi:hypothetical protein
MQFAVLVITHKRVDVDVIMRKDVGAPEASSAFVAAIAIITADRKDSRGKRPLYLSDKNPAMHVVREVILK